MEPLLVMILRSVKAVARVPLRLTVSSTRASSSSSESGAIQSGRHPAALGELDPESRRAPHLGEEVLDHGPGGRQLVLQDEGIGEGDVGLVERAGGPGRRGRRGRGGGRGDRRREGRPRGDAGREEAEG